MKSVIKHTYYCMNVCCFNSLCTIQQLLIGTHIFVDEESQVLSLLLDKPDKLRFLWEANGCSCVCSVVACWFITVFIRIKMSNAYYYQALSMV